jgi:tetratricopeptide (TPR) repeat protein
MTRPIWIVVFAALAACAPAAASEPPIATTSGAIAIANLDHLIGQAAPTDAVDLWLARARFLGDTDALERAYRAAAAPPPTTAALLRRAHTRAAVHEFRGALADLELAERAGAAPAALTRDRATIAIALGRPDDALAACEADQRAAPGFAAESALAGAYAAAGRFADADAHYRAALTALAATHTTSPLPYAWLYFARGMLWTEQADAPSRGAAMYERALAYLPDFVAARVHLAEIEAARGDLAPAIARLAPIAGTSRDPEALGLLGRLHVAAGAPVLGAAEIARARLRYDELLAPFPLAFADHAAELLLGPLGDRRRAATLAAENLANRATPRAIELMLAALSNG